MEKTNQNGLDILKFILAIFVVALHSNLEKTLDLNLYNYILNILLRLAVPVFFLSSGYFFAKNYKKSNNYSRNYLKNLAIHYLFWSSLYLVVYVLIYLYLKKYNDIVDLVLRYVKLTPNGAMWYVSSLIISVLLLRIFMKNKKVLKYSIIVAGFLTLFAQTVFFIACTSQSSFFAFLADFLFKIKSGFYDSVCFGYFFTALGYYLSKNNIVCNRKNCCYLIIIGAILCVMQTKFINAHMINDTAIQIELPYGIFLSSIGLFYLSLNVNVFKNKDTKVLRKISSTMFYIHYLVITVCKVVFKELTT